MESVEYNGFVYHVGDKVMMNDPYWEEGYPPNGSIGEIKAIDRNIAVEWETAFKKGHSCGDLIPGKHGRYYRLDKMVDKSYHEHVSLLIPLLQTESQAEIEESDDLLAFIHDFAL